MDPEIRFGFRCLWDIQNIQNTISETFKRRVLHLNKSLNKKNPLRQKDNHQDIKITKC